MSGDTFEAEPEVIRAHSSRIQGLAARLDTANGAADETLDSNAFGIFGQFLAIGCVAQGAAVKAVIAGAAGSAHLGKGALDLTAQTYEMIEQANETLFQGGN